MTSTPVAMVVRRNVNGSETIRMKEMSDAVRRGRRRNKRKERTKEEMEREKRSEAKPERRRYATIAQEMIYFCLLLVFSVNKLCARY